MNIFEQAVEDIWKVEDMRDTCIIAGIGYSCWVSKRTDQLVYSGAGLVEDCPITISIPVMSISIRDIKKGVRIKYRDREYKIDSVGFDSTNTCIELALVDVSAGV